MPFVIDGTSSDTTYRDYVDAERNAIEDALRTYGAVLFRGFAIPGLETFEDFARLFCKTLYNEYGDLPTESGNVYQVTPHPHTESILFHNESSHLKSWPTKQLFYCYTPAKSGGQTPIADCRRIYRDLTESDKQYFVNGLTYVRNFKHGIDVPWQEFFKTNDRKKVAAYCIEHEMEFDWKSDEELTISHKSLGITRHPVTGEMIFFNQFQLYHPTFLNPDIRQFFDSLSPCEYVRNVFTFDGGPIPEDVALRVGALYEKHSVDFFWQLQDVLLVDNMLLAHARKPYMPPRKMYVIMGDLISRDLFARVGVNAVQNK